MSDHFRLRALLEDRAHEASLRGLCDRDGRVRDLRVEPYPSARGAAEQFVRERFPSFVSALRTQRHQQGLWGVVVIDGDLEGLQRRRQRLLESLVLAGLPPLSDDDRVALLVPTRNIETWAWCLLGNQVNEVDDYKHRVAVPLRALFRERWMAETVAASPSLVDGRQQWSRVG